MKCSDGFIYVALWWEIKHIEKHFRRPELNDMDIVSKVAEIRQRVKGPDRRISVVRTQPWYSARQCFSRPAFQNATGMLKVTFIGAEETATDKEAYDLGGPRREFYRLLLNDAVHNSGLLQGKLS